MPDTNALQQKVIDNQSAALDEQGKLIKELKAAKEALEAVNVELEGDIVLSNMKEINGKVKEMINSCGETYREVSRGRSYTRSKSRQIGYDLNGVFSTLKKISRSM